MQQPRNDWWGSASQTDSEQQLWAEHTAEIMKQTLRNIIVESMKTILIIHKCNKKVWQYDQFIKQPLKKQNTNFKWNQMQHLRPLRPQYPAAPLNPHRVCFTQPYSVIIRIICKLAANYIAINTNIDKYGKKCSDHICCHIVHPLRIQGIIWMFISSEALPLALPPMY